MNTNETKTVTRWWWVWDFEQEERWLNEMVQEGWLLNGVGFCVYHFVRCEPGEYVIRLQMNQEGSDYLNFMKDLGAEHIGNMVQWSYFRRKAELGSFELFSDVDSRINHLKKIVKMLLIICAMNIVIGIVNSFNTTARLGVVNLLVACLLTYAIGRIHGKMVDLKEERMLHE